MVPLELEPNRFCDGFLGCPSSRNLGWSAAVFALFLSEDALFESRIPHGSLDPRNLHKIDTESNDHPPEFTATPDSESGGINSYGQATKLLSARSCHDWRFFERLNDHEAFATEEHLEGFAAAAAD